jgi:hypothetical protein
MDEANLSSECALSFVVALVSLIWLLVSFDLDLFLVQVVKLDE